jgi:hypothetical protein
LFEQDSDGSELSKSEEILGVIFPPNQEKTLPLYPGKEELNQPAPILSVLPTTVLRLWFRSILSMRQDHLITFYTQCLFQIIAVVGTFTYQVFRLRSDQVEIKTQLHQSDFIMIGRECTHRQRQPMTIDNRHTAAMLKKTMDRFVAQIALRQHVPLCTGIENTRNGFNDFAGGD